MAEQEEEDAAVHERVDAEVQGAVAAVRAAAEARTAAAEAAAEELRAKLAAVERKSAGLAADLSAWEAAVAERDAELRSLQVLLLTSHSHCAFPWSVVATFSRGHKTRFQDEV